MIGANATCDCTDTGFTGDACELDIDECENGDICGIGQCFNSNGNYTCDCPGKNILEIDKKIKFKKF